MTAEIVLEGLSFYAYHGFYEEERKAGGKFSVDVKVIMNIEENSDFDDLSNTVDYEKIYKIVQIEMLRPAKLLEHISKNILDQIFIKISRLESAEVSISKFSPPIGGPCEKAKVTLRRAK
jgi:7,8-dihydroneopterin aldolase/epimerase/oxygenase